MKLLIQRNQKSGLTGKMKYTLYVRAQLTDAEAALVRKNRLENELLLYFDRDEHKSGGFTKNAKNDSGFLAAALRLLRDISLTVAALIHGETFTCDNVGQLLSVEAETIIAAKNLKRYIQTAATFGGEIALDIDDMIQKEDEEL